MRGTVTADEALAKPPGACVPVYSRLYVSSMPAPRFPNLVYLSALPLYQRVQLIEFAVLNQVRRDQQRAARACVERLLRD